MECDSLTYKLLDPWNKNKQNNLDICYHFAFKWEIKFSKIFILKVLYPITFTFYLLPLDGSRGLGGDVVKDAVDALYFIEDAVAGFPQQGRDRKSVV